MHYQIRQGYWRSDTDAPVRAIDDIGLPGSTAVVGADFPGLRPTFLVAQGDEVTAGQVLFTDRNHSQIAHVAPCAGTVAQLEYGPRRTLSACVIKPVGKTTSAAQQVTPLDDSTDVSVRHVLQGRGMWPAFRTRPFGRTPAPDDRPFAIFVNAVQGAAAPDPHVVLDGRMEMFAKGADVLTKLTDGLVHVCQSKGAPLCPVTNRVRVTTFGGTMASALAGTHIDRLCPVQSGRQVWTVGYQDVVAIGHLFATGQYAADRVVAVGGPLLESPKLVRTILGARIADITANHIADGANPVFRSGTPLNAHEAVFLGRFDMQVTATPRPVSKVQASWKSWLSFTQGALIPTASLDRALAPRVLSVPLMRALSVGDSDAARRLGCLALVEEDVAILCRLCTSGADYRVLLRHVLDELMEDAA
ncbi:Na+-transporting NADH:ubiquinone oxidoreductase subunit A [Yoonia maricola]|uniref:Na+-transporting NADH:ubiquinone oxidoreductase subunit A n=1 Tax=Yoonia maricola TaxID=420999 RepID=A0A2M8W0D2_9RHOB|nr:hypothetical protein [Yoonia maricola]PJI84372.1 Na+-transporting NADH:ubiquinone oxidoreductase subunit A [Yoonia maricola]